MKHGAPPQGWHPRRAGTPAAGQVLVALSAIACRAVDLPEAVQVPRRCAEAIGVSPSGSALGAHLGGRRPPTRPPGRWAPCENWGASSVTHYAELTLELSARALCQRHTFHGPGVARCMWLCVTRVGGGMNATTARNRWIEGWVSGLNCPCWALWRIWTSSGGLCPAQSSGRPVGRCMNGPNLPTYSTACLRHGAWTAIPVASPLCSLSLCARDELARDRFAATAPMHDLHPMGEGQP